MMSQLISEEISNKYTIQNTVLPDRKQVLEFGSSSRNPSTPACILTDAIPSCFRSITNSSLTIIFFKKKVMSKLGHYCLVLAKI